MYPTLALKIFVPRLKWPKAKKWQVPLNKPWWFQGLGLVKAQAEAEGLDKVLIEAGFEWREPGCSMCLAMNADKLQPGEHCASTSNRNFEGRQGNGGRTHLVSSSNGSGSSDCRSLCRCAFILIRAWEHRHEKIYR